MMYHHYSEAPYYAAAPLPAHPRDMVLLPSMLFRDHLVSSPPYEQTRPAPTTFALPSIKSLLCEPSIAPVEVTAVVPTKPRWRPSKYCTVEACERVSQRNGLCHRHGGKRSCKDPSCNAKDRGNGYCIKHGGGRPCDVAHCGKKARRQGMCTQHFRLVNTP
ncbi:hypothetical protein SPRG_12503 [Saprolegnia parasitica CBS 223.65]|uniref:Uncharacterized protein n=2 Tax=Saprolegnia parasitica (strain CBS 223.65) TaxID=695850 RepID=A0A067BSE8_SAPPC|nr:hypothetical protein SPRG_12503 [Saprolegnia parasitica CBS 223.65]KDO21459.1 hypothetical protein SPRG_12503 [Saprolegnia parasitica CBS 223.65]|eukprot:XP_012207804.1 hypothetical protein SPRG_12503 [Saprolegnia parasitica CBS 223.65]